MYVQCYKKNKLTLFYLSDKSLGSSMGSNLVILAVVSPLLPPDTSCFSLWNCSKISNLPMTCPYWACSFAKLCNIRLLSVCRVLTSILRSSFSISSLVTRFLYLTIDSSSAEVWPEVGEEARFGTFSISRGHHTHSLRRRGFLFRLFLPALFLFAHRRYNFQAHIPFQLCLIPPLLAQLGQS